MARSNAEIVRRLDRLFTIGHRHNIKRLLATFNVGERVVCKVDQYAENERRPVVRVGVSGSIYSIMYGKLCVHWSSGVKLAVDPRHVEKTKE